MTQVRRESAQFGLDTLQSGGIRAAHGQVRIAGQWLSLWDSYGLDGYAIRCCNLSEDARGRWYLNACVAVPMAEHSKRAVARGEVDIDLGPRYILPG